MLLVFQSDPESWNQTAVATWSTSPGCRILRGLPPSLPRFIPRTAFPPAQLFAFFEDDALSPEELPEAGQEEAEELEPEEHFEHSLLLLLVLEFFFL